MTLYFSTMINTQLKTIFELMMAMQENIYRLLLQFGNVCPVLLNLIMWCSPAPSRSLMHNEMQLSFTSVMESDLVDIESYEDKVFDERSLRINYMYSTLEFKRSAATEILAVEPTEPARNEVIASIIPKLMLEGKNTI